MKRIITMLLILAAFSCTKTNSVPDNGHWEVKLSSEHFEVEPGDKLVIVESDGNTHQEGTRIEVNAKEGVNRYSMKLVTKTPILTLWMKSAKTGELVFADQFRPIRRE